MRSIETAVFGFFFSVIVLVVFGNFFVQSSQRKLKTRSSTQEKSTKFCFITKSEETVEN
jgi:uncharacterized membrane protein YiaA